MTIPARLLNTIADLRAEPAPAGAAHVLGCLTPGDGGGGTFYWDAAADASDNGGTIIAPGQPAAAGRWLCEPAGCLSVKWFSARGDAQTAAGGSIQPDPPTSTIRSPHSPPPPQISRRRIKEDGSASKAPPHRSACRRGLPDMIMGRTM